MVKVKMDKVKTRQFKLKLS